MAKPKMVGVGLERIIDIPKGTAISIYSAGSDRGNPFSTGTVQSRRFTPKQPENSATIVVDKTGAVVGHFGSGTAVRRIRQG